MLLLPCKLNAVACVFVANLFSRSTALVRFGCLDVARRWRSVRRAAALLVKAAAAAASGELLPSCACIHRIIRWRKAPLLTLDLHVVAVSSIGLPPAAESLRLLNVGAGKQHARVRSSSRN